MGSTKKVSQQGVLRELGKIGFAQVEQEAVKPGDKMKALEMMVRLLGLDEPEEKVLKRLDEVLEKMDG